MTPSRLDHRVIWLVGALAALPAPCGGADDANQLIDGVISRATAIHSVQMNYSHHAYLLRDGRPTEESTNDVQLTVDGANWAMRYDDSKNFRMQRGQAAVSFVEIASARHNKIFRTLFVAAPTSFQELINEGPHNAAPRLGGFWYSVQVGFIDQHRQQVVVRGERQVDGIATIEMEWPVKGLDFDEAMLIIPDRISRDLRGRLRICVAPQLGYALPRIEYVSENGHVEHEVTATDFVDHGSSIYIPRRGTARTEVANGYEVGSFVIHNVTHLNEPLPPDTFSMKIPLGTRVSDSRPGVPQSTIDLESQDQLEQLNKALGDSDSASSGRTGRLLLTLNSVCFLICLSIYVMQRCFRTS
jgi:hypothetical protein